MVSPALPSLDHHHDQCGDPAARDHLRGSGRTCGAPGLGGVIPANMGDTGGTALGIFQGYIQEVPYGGTSPWQTLPNLDPRTLRRWNPR